MGLDLGLDVTSLFRISLDLKIRKAWLSAKNYWKSGMADGEEGPGQAVLRKSFRVVVTCREFPGLGTLLQRTKWLGDRKLALGSTPTPPIPPQQDLLFPQQNSVITNVNPGPAWPPGTVQPSSILILTEPWLPWQKGDDNSTYMTINTQHMLDLNNKWWLLGSEICNEEGQRTQSVPVLGSWLEE